MKIAKRIILAVVILLVLLVAGALLFLDSIVKGGIEKGGAYATGVPTEVQTVKLSLFSGSFTMDQLKISNPSGFHSPHAMKTGKFDLEVVPSSVAGSPVQVRKFILDGLDINVDQAGGKNNISVILDHIKSLGDAGQQSSPAQPASPAKGEPAAGDKGRKIMVDKIIIRNVVAHFYLPGPLEGQKITVDVPTVELDNVSSDNNGATVSQLVSRIIPATLAAVMEKGKDIIPKDLLGTLNTDISSTASALGGEAGKMLQKAGLDASKLGNATAKSVGDIKHGIEGLLKKQ